MFSYEDEKKEDVTKVSIKDEEVFDMGEQYEVTESPVPSDKVSTNGSPKEDPSKELPHEDIFYLKDVKVGTRIANTFIFYGEVSEIWKDKKGNTMWKIVYDDDDEEDFNDKELSTALALYEEKKESDKPRKRRKKLTSSTCVSRATKRPRKCQQKYLFGP